jgi:hypothetical protein
MHYLITYFSLPCFFCITFHPAGMILSRNQFFLLLSILGVAPFYLSKILWLSNSKQTTGIVWFMGHTLELHGDISNHLVVLLKAGKDSVTFNSSAGLGYRIGDSVPVRYQKDNPSDARINIPYCIWTDTLVNSLLPILILLVLFFTPERFAPLIPKKAKVRLGIKPFLKIIPDGSDT